VGNKKVGNCEITPQALWSIAKSLVKSDGSNAQTVVHRPLGIPYHQNEKASAIAGRRNILSIRVDILTGQRLSHN
jgi:hypothetical protein